MIKSNLNFIVGLVTIIIFIIFSIKDDKVVSNYTIAKANFNRIDGINIGSDIRMSGIKIGNENCPHQMNFNSSAFMGSKGKCNKQKWARSCNVTWDGITNAHGLC